MATKEVLKQDLQQKGVTELADAHCHLDMISAAEVGEAINGNVKTMITNGVDIKSDMAAIRTG